MRHFRVEKYNPEHYIDLTAAIAVSRADRRKTIAFVARGGSYRIGDIYRFEWKNGVLYISRAITRMETDERICEVVL